MSNIDDFNIIEKELNSNALFKLSLGSKELFHSNFIESVLGINDENGHFFAMEFFRQFGIKELFENSIIVSDREKKNTDIMFKLFMGGQDSEEDEPYKVIVIENKVKSLPDIEQLNRYKKKFEKKENYEYYLLSLIQDFGFEPEEAGWISKRYNDVAKSFEEALKQAVKNNKMPLLGANLSFPELINEYCNFIKTLDKFSQAVKTTPGEVYNFWDGKYPVNFRKLRIHDLFLKLKYKQIQIITEKALIKKGYETGVLRKDQVPNPDLVYVNTDFTNSKGLFDINILIGHLKVIKGKKASLLLSVQLQGDQLRYCSYIHSDLPDNEIKKIHKKVIKYVKDVWFNNNALNIYADIKETLVGRKGEGRPEKKGKKKPGYDKFDDEFYFRYDIISNTKTGETPDKLVNPTINDITGFFVDLATFIIDNRKVFVEEIQNRSKIQFVECQWLDEQNNSSRSS